MALTRSRAGAFAQQQIAGVFEERHHFAERDFRADFSGQLGDADHVARSDAKLLSTGFDNCMHLEMNLDWIGEPTGTLQPLSTTPKLRF